MPEKITVEILEERICLLNRIVGAPADMWMRDADCVLIRNERGNLVANQETYTLDQSNGGVALATHGGAKTVISRGSKSELHDQIRAFIDGVHRGMELSESSS